MFFKESSERKKNVCLPLCAQKEAAGYACLQLTLPLSYMSSKEVQIFITLINITALRNITQVKSSETNK